MNKDFFNGHEQENGEQDLSYAVEQYKAAYKQGRINELMFTEEEFEFVVDYYMDENNQEQALKVSELAFKKHPYSSLLLVKLCDSLIVAGFCDKAIKVLDKYKNSFTQNHEIYLLFARAYIKRQDFAQAKESFAEAMSLVTDFKAVDVVDSIWALAQDCIELENYTEAVYYLKMAIPLNPDNYEYYSDLAFCYDKLNDSATALEYYNKYLDKDPFNDYVWFNVGTVHARNKEFDKAIEAFEYSLALNSENDSSLYNLGIVYLNLDRYKEALEYFKLCYDSDGHSVVASLGLADAYLGLKDLEKSKKYFREALTADESCEEARMGYDCVLAVEQYLKGERLKFMEQMRVIADRDITWVNTLYTIFPQLGSDSDFLNLLSGSDKHGNI